MKLSERLPAAITAFLRATRWSARRLSVEAGRGQSLVANVLGGASCTLRSADAILAVILTHAPDTPEGRCARALADLGAPPEAAAPPLCKSA